MISLFGRWIIWSPLPEWTLKEVNCKYWFLKWTVNLTWRDYSYHLVEREPMNSKRQTKQGRAGFLLGSTKKSFICLVMVVQFHQITAEISSTLKNEMNCDSTSRSLPVVTETIREELLQASSLPAAAANRWEQRPLSCLTQGSSLRARLKGCWQAEVALLQFKECVHPTYNLFFFFATFCSWYNLFPLEP